MVNWRNYAGSIAVFQSTSSLGSSYILVDGVLVVQRQPERVRGVEAQATYRVTDSTDDAVPERALELTEE